MFHFNVMARCVGEFLWTECVDSSLTATHFLQVAGVMATQAGEMMRFADFSDMSNEKIQTFWESTRESAMHIDNIYGNCLGNLWGLPSGSLW